MATKPILNSEAGTLNATIFIMLSRTNELENRPFFLGLGCRLFITDYLVEHTSQRKPMRGCINYQDCRRCYEICRKSAISGSTRSFGGCVLRGKPKLNG